MASNVLVANLTKYIFMMLNNKKKENEGTIKITVGHHQIQKSKSTKFYAMMIDLQRAENCPE